MIEDDLETIKCKTDEVLFKYVENWLLELRNRSASAALTVTAYISDLKFFILFMSQHLNKNLTVFSLQELKPADYRAWLAAELSSGTCHRSNARKLSGVKSFLKYLNREIDFPLKNINAVRRPKLPQLLPHPIDIEIIEHLLSVKCFSEKDPAWITLRDKALYMTLYGAGLRIQEALNIKLGAINSYLKVIGKGHKERVIPLLDKIQSAIKSYIKKCPYIDENDPNCYIFWSVTGKRLKRATVEERLKNFRELFNYPDYFTPHALRHSFASHLLNAGVEMRYVQELLGHSSLATTEIYTDINNNTVLDIYKKSHPLEMLGEK